LYINIQPKVFKQVNILRVT